MASACGRGYARRRDRNVEKLHSAPLGHLGTHHIAPPLGMIPEMVPTPRWLSKKSSIHSYAEMTSKLVNAISIHMQASAVHRFSHNGDNRWIYLADYRNMSDTQRAYNSQAHIHRKMDKGSKANCPKHCNRSALILSSVYIPSHRIKRIISMPMYFFVCISFVDRRSVVENNTHQVRTFITTRSTGSMFPIRFSHKVLNMIRQSVNLRTVAKQHGPVIHYRP